MNLSDVPVSKQRAVSLAMNRLGFRRADAISFVESIPRPNNNSADTISSSLLNKALEDALAVIAKGNLSEEARIWKNFETETARDSTIRHELSKRRSRVEPSDIEMVKKIEKVGEIATWRVSIEDIVEFLVENSYQFRTWTSAIPGSWLRDQVAEVAKSIPDAQDRSYFRPSVARRLEDKLAPRVAEYQREQDRRFLAGDGSIRVHEHTARGTVSKLYRP